MSALSQITKTEQDIAALEKEFMPLRLAGVDDKAGYERVKAARMVVVRHRTTVEKLRVKLKADALEYGRAVDAEAKRVTALLEPVESHLRAQQDIVDNEAKRIAAEAEAKRKAKLDGRMADLRQYESLLAPSQVEPLSDDQFMATLEDARVAFNAIQDERDRIAAEAKAKADAEAAARKAEQDRLDAQREQMELEQAERRKEQEKIDAANREAAAKIAAERAAVEAERRKVEADAAEQRRQIELEAAKKAAAEKAIADAEAKRQRDAAEAARLDALKPEIEKVRAIADSLLDIDVPCPTYAGRVHQILRSASDDIKALVG